LHRRLIGPQSRSGRCGGEKNIAPVGNRNPVVQPVAISAEPSRLCNETFWDETDVTSSVIRKIENRKPGLHGNIRLILEERLVSNVLRRSPAGTKGRRRSIHVYKWKHVLSPLWKMEARNTDYCGNSKWQTHKEIKPRKAEGGRT
jgi:hypothetical protein